MSIKVLVVDDEPRNGRLLETLLQAEGYQTFVARNGVDALAIAKREQPAIALLDLMMPDMDGFELIRRLRAEPDTAAITLVVASALDDEAARQRVQAAGVAALLTKPLDRFALLRCLQRLV